MLNLIITPEHNVLSVLLTDKGGASVIQLNSETQNIEYSSIVLDDYPRGLAYSRETNVLWILTHELTGFRLDHQKEFLAPLPRVDLIFRNISSFENQIVLIGEQCSVFFSKDQADSWEVINLAPDFDGEIQFDTDDLEKATEDYSQELSKYIIDHPSILGSFPNASNLLLCGGHGYVGNVHNGKLQKSGRINDLPLLAGAALQEGQSAILSRGDLSKIHIVDDAFKVTREVELDANFYTMMVTHADKIYIGVEISAAGHGLFRLEDDKLVPVYTGCEQEPGPLIGLDAKDGVMWLADLDAFFRYDGSVWDRIPYELPA